MVRLTYRAYRRGSAVVYRPLADSHFRRRAFAWGLLFALIIGAITAGVYDSGGFVSAVDRVARQGTTKLRLALSGPYNDLFPLPPPPPPLPPVSGNAIEKPVPPSTNLHVAAPGDGAGQSYEQSKPRPTRPLRTKQHAAAVPLRRQSKTKASNGGLTAVNRHVKHDARVAASDAIRDLRLR